MNESSHIPVLCDDVVRLLHPEAGQTYFDGTAGYGGHAAAVHEKMGPSGRLLLVDRDAQAVTALRSRFGTSATILHDDYLHAATELLASGDRLDMVLLDLGVSSPQLDQASRGFSFSADGPLDMRMDQSEDTDSARTAATIVNTMGEGELADLIYAFGEERQSRRIASAIVRARPITTTSQLAEVVAAAIGRGQKIHPATRTFQALRIAVNSELEQLEAVLPVLVQLLKPGGRLAVISFHSLEDRVVKEFFRRQSRDCICPPEQPICTCDHVASLRILTKSPVLGTTDAFNPRARSAKLRAAVKLTPKPKEA
ncbi:MAG TPA: 16S rRNA (cytosine(1402)-N(4))-methyltransferase RsmH [Candidatus Saccharimonadales bacterium]|nr:16S rRNA (cytosine(1402)-N(4))-methyltransferase RsmH [Candidatus Saccharimonadales bacterium]